MALALTLAVFAPASLYAEGAKPYTALPTVRPGYSAAANKVNDFGQVVGDDGRPLFWRSVDQPPVVLGSLGGDGSGSATSVNNLGQVVGYSRTAGEDGHAFLWTTGGGMRDLGTLGGPVSVATDINDSGLIVGWSLTATNVVHAFFWTEASGMTDLGTLCPLGAQLDSQSLSMNSAGHVVGSCSYGGFNYRAFLWTPAAGLVDLGTLGGPSSVAMDINDGDTIVGWSTDRDLRAHAFILPAGGTMSALPADLNDVWSFATSINNAGAVVGLSRRNTAPLRARGFVWTPAGGLAALGWEGNYSSPSSVNNAGLIVGQVGYSDPDSLFSYARGVTWRWSWDDVVVDRGASGLWLLGARGTALSPISGLNPHITVRGDVDSNGVDDLVVDFGPALGVWIWANHQTWFQLHPFSADHIAVGDLDGNGYDDVVLSFPGLGTWVWLNHAEWRPVHDRNPTLMAVRRGIGLVLNFAGAGVWIATLTDPAGPITWTQIHTRDASVLVIADVLPVQVGLGPVNTVEPPLEIILGFPGAGLWCYLRPGQVFDGTPAWTRLHPFDVRRVVAGDLDGKGTDDLVIDFGYPWGLWILKNGTTWSLLHGFTAEHVALADLDGLGRDEIVVDFGPPYGLYVYSTVTGRWQPLGDVRVEGLTTGGFH